MKTRIIALMLVLSIVNPSIAFHDSVNTGLSSETVQLLAPTNGSLDGIAPVLTWSAVPGATGYTVIAAYDPACLNFESLPENCLSCLWVLSHPTNTLSMENYGAGTYYWRVAVYNQDTGGQTGWSEIWSFTINAPLLSSPVNGVLDVDVDATLKWSSYSEAITYDLTVYGGSKSLEIHDITENQFSLTNLALTRYYVWKVRAITSLGKTGWSEPWHFQTTGLIPLDGLIHWSPFNENVNDLCFDGRLIGAETPGVVEGATLNADRFGNENRACSFNGVSDYILFSGITEYYDQDGYLYSKSYKLPDRDGQRSLSLWFKSSKTLDEFISVDLIGWGQSSPNKKFGFALKNGTPQFDGYGDDVTGIGQWDNDQWHNVIITYDGTKIDVYMDGVFNIHINSNLSTTKGPLLIGKSMECAQRDTYFDGVIDDIAIYKRVLSAEEIQFIASKK